MRLLNTFCLVMLFALSSQALERTLTIEASYKAPGSSEYVTVWTAENVVLSEETQTCYISHGLFPVYCMRFDLDRDSRTSHRIRIRMNMQNFSVFTRQVSVNPDLTEADIKKYNRNIRDYINDAKNLSPRYPIEFYFFEEIEQSTTMPSFDYQSSTKITVIQH